jgi:hypothetical protein
MNTTTCTSFNHIQLLSSMNRYCVHQRWNLHPSWHCHCQPNITQHEWIYFPNLVQLKDLMPPMQFKPKKKKITMTPCWSFFPFNKYLDVYTKKLMCFYMIMPMPFGDWKGQKAFIFFVLVTFFRPKISIILQSMQTSSILSWVIVISLAIFWISPL